MRKEKTKAIRSFKSKQRVLQMQIVNYELVLFNCPYNTDLYKVYIWI